MANKSIEIQKELLELVRLVSVTADNLYRVGKAAQQDVIKALLEQTDILNKLTWTEKDLMWSHGAGADVIKRIAAPMIGGVISSFLLELMVYPVIFEIWKGWRMRRSAHKV